MNIYQEELMDHYRNPRNHGRLPHPDFTSGEYNPSCGDSIALEGCVKHNMLAEIAFVGKGCVISQAAASMLTEACKGKPVNDLLALDKDFILTMIGIQLGPTRLKCALLPLQALQGGIINYKE